MYKVDVMYARCEFLYFNSNNLNLICGYLNKLDSNHDFILVCQHQVWACLKNWNVPLDDYRFIIHPKYKEIVYTNSIDVEASVPISVTKVETINLTYH